MQQNINSDKSILLSKVRHSSAHLLAAAVEQLWPNARFGVGPAIENGFYYDIDLADSITEKDLKKIEDRMNRLKKQNLKFERIEVSIDKAIEIMEEKKQFYKVELLKMLKEKGSTAIKELDDENIINPDNNNMVSLYKTGDFIDLCRGPHVESTGELGFFKLLRVSGAYWRGDKDNAQLQRIYGTTFLSQEELEHYLWQLEEAKKRDHRKLGKELEIYTFSEEIGQGLPLWLPNGTIIREELEKLAKETERKYGYQRVVTPHITKESLYIQSGHLPYYKDDMYSPIVIENENYYLKPMNCPHHHHIYLAKPRSYRDLPIRLTEYGQVYRYELSGALSGLMRTRGFSQNDAHIYCSFEQAKEEFIKVMKLHAQYYEMFGIKDYYMLFAKPDLNNLSKYIDQPEKWIKAMDIIKDAMEESGYPYREAEGEAAFYGPKIDFMIKNAIGNEYAISTNQLDFLATERFNLTYKGSNDKDLPVYVIHRAPLGSHERFIAFLIEHYAGKFPTWLSPVQVSVIPISDRHFQYSRSIYEKLFSADVDTAHGGIRVEFDDSNESMQKKIKKAQLKKVPYMLIIGDKELESDTVSLRLRDGSNIDQFKVADLIEKIKGEIVNRSDI